MSTDDRNTLNPIEGDARPGRQRLGLRGELTLAFFPTVTTLLVLWTVDVVTDQRVLFAALASSAFLIYLDPMHGSNSIRTVTASHLIGALAGMSAGTLMGNGYGAAGLAMVSTILIMVIANVVHPPAIGTSLSFAYHSGLSANFFLFLLVLGMVVILVVLQRIMQYLLVRLTL